MEEDPEGSFYPSLVMARKNETVITSSIGQLCQNDFISLEKFRPFDWSTYLYSVKKKLAGDSLLYRSEKSFSCFMNFEKLCFDKLYCHKYVLAFHNVTNYASKNYILTKRVPTNHVSKNCISTNYILVKCILKN